MHLVSHIVADGENAQDRVGVFKFDDRVVLTIADGAGGRSGGGEAADAAIKTIFELASNLQSEEDCVDALLKADAAIEASATAGETTAVLVVVRGSDIVGASIGDSGAWMVTENSVDVLSAEQNRRPFLGVGMSEPVGFSRPQLRGILLLATDGLLKYTSREAICKVVRQSPFDLACKELVRLVRYPSGALPDDVAIAICRLA